jgi:serine/threonine protein kinase
MHTSVGLADPVQICVAAAASASIPSLVLVEAMSKRQPTATAGKRLGRYRIERELGRGGMGVVYLAVDENLARTVALKTTSVAGLGSGQDSRGQRRARFIREVKALAQVSHENVVHVFDAGEADDSDLGWVLFYTMEHVDGVTLAQLVHKQGALPPGAAAAVCMQVGAGLGAAHVQGIVHRDVKPANIFLTRDSRALIGDFGICKIEGSTQITRRDQLVGTPNYLAPEQILGEEISPATDVFALGALFYVIATNSPLREKTDAASLLREASTNDPAKKVLNDKRFPDELRKVVARSLDRDPKKRFPDGAAFADALADHATRIPLFEPSDPVDKPNPSVGGGLDTGTSTFAKMPTPGSEPSGESAFAVSGTGAGGVEEVAKALLQGFGDDEKPHGDDAGGAKKPALPVARTESTVMFNIRQLEDEQQKDAKKAPPTKRSRSELPLALSEPSGPMDRPASMSVSLDETARAPNDDTADPMPADITSDGVDDDAADGFDGGKEDTFVGPRDDDERLSLAAGDTESVARVKAPTTTTTPTVKAPRAPTVGPVLEKLAAELRARAQDLATRGRALPPVALLILVSIGGMLIALVLIVAIASFTGRFGSAPPHVEITAEVPIVESEVVPVVVDEMPAACQGRAKNDRDRQAAMQFYAKAIEAFQTFKKPEALALVDKALAKNPRLPEAHFIRARILAEEKDKLAESRAAYDCVIALSPDSADADAARRAIGK